MKKSHGPAFALILLVTLLAVACKKDSHSLGADNALTIYGPTNIRINEAEVFYDSTALSDSPYYFIPPTDRFYRWTISPADPVAAISGPYQYGKAYIIFNRAGTFSVKADIYDSLNQHLLGHTTQATVQVSSDTLYPSEPLTSGDTLSGGYNIYLLNNDTVVLSIVFATAKSYPAYGPSTYLVYTTTYTNGINIDFSDSAYLSTFPFIYYAPWQVQVGAGWQYAFVGPDTEKLNITWLGNTYSGIVNVDAAGNLSLTWNNQGNVQLHALHSMIKPRASKEIANPFP